MFYETLQQVAWTAATAVFVAFCGMCVVGLIKVVFNILDDIDKGV